MRLAWIRSENLDLEDRELSDRPVVVNDSQIETLLKNDPFHIGHHRDASYISYEDCAAFENTCIHTCLRCLSATRLKNWNSIYAVDKYTITYSTAFANP